MIFAWAVCLPLPDLLWFGFVFFVWFAWLCLALLACLPAGRSVSFVCFFWLVAVWWQDADAAAGAAVANVEIASSLRKNVLYKNFLEILRPMVFPEAKKNTSVRIRGTGQLGQLRQSRCIHFRLQWLPLFWHRKTVLQSPSWNDKTEWTEWTHYVHFVYLCWPPPGCLARWWDSRSQAYEKMRGGLLAIHVSQIFHVHSFCKQQVACGRNGPMALLFCDVGESNCLTFRVERTENQFAEVRQWFAYFMSYSE